MECALLGYGLKNARHRPEDWFADSQKELFMRQLGKYCDLATLAIGAILFISPWVLGFGAPKPNLPTQIVSVIGAAIGVTGIATVIAFEIWELYIVIAFAIASIASPWLFSISEDGAFVALILGGLSALATSGAHIIIIRHTRNERQNLFKA